MQSLEPLAKALEVLDAAKADAPEPRTAARIPAAWNHYYERLDAATQAVIKAAREAVSCG